MSIRYYINLVEALAVVPPTEGPTSTPEEQTIDDGGEASAQGDGAVGEPEPAPVRTQAMPATR